MSQVSADSTRCLSSRRLLQRQGVSSRAVAVQNRFIKKWAVWIGIITFMALFYVWSRVQVVQLGYQITVLKGQETELSKKISNLETEINTLKSPARLEEFARKELSMQSPSAEQIVLVQRPGAEKN